MHKTRDKKLQLKKFMKTSIENGSVEQRLPARAKGTIFRVNISNKTYPKINLIQIREL